MNIHEYQAKTILKNFGIPVPEGIVLLDNSDVENQISKLKSENLVVKAQIHAGGRGKAGGVKLLNKSDCETQRKKMFG